MYVWEYEYDEISKKAILENAFEKLEYLWILLELFIILPFLGFM